MRPGWAWHQRQFFMDIGLGLILIAFATKPAILGIHGKNFFKGENLINIIHHLLPLYSFLQLLEEPKKP